MEDWLSFYRGRRVLVTGHTGFKGAWLCRLLLEAGAEVTGYALESPTQPSLYELAGLEDHLRSVLGDVRDLSCLQKTFQAARSEVVFHLAAQPIVRKGYQDPVGTYSTNVMGTVHLLECVRQTDMVESVVVVTTDKVYQDREWCWGYREADRLDGFDPYANSKSCSELACGCYVRSFFGEAGPPVSTVRAGNVIGGGDFAPDRIVPDCVRAVLTGRPIVVRSPSSVRPYQHVLDPLGAYLLLAQRQREDLGLAGSYNVGPEEQDCVTTGALADLFCAAWGEGASWTYPGATSGPREAVFLRLDCAKARSLLGWHPRWHVEEAVRETVDWTKAWRAGEDVAAYMGGQIADYIAE